MQPAQPTYEEPQTEEEVGEEEAYAPEQAAAPKTYKVKAGDTLSKIAKDIYGKASKWTVIYEANAAKIKDPNKVMEGTILEIPVLEEAESKYTK